MVGEILPINRVHLRGNLELPPGSLRNFNRAIKTLFRADASQKCKIFPRFFLKMIEALWDPVVDCAAPPDPRQRLPLRIGNRDDVHIFEFLIERDQIRNSKLAMKSRNSRDWLAPCPRKVEIVDMEVQNVELMGFLKNQFKQADVMRDRVNNRGRAQSQRALRCWNEPRAGYRIRAREKRNIVVCGNELLGQIRNNSFRATVMFWRHALVKRSNLGNFHRRYPLILRFWRLVRMDAVLK